MTTMMPTDGSQEEEAPPQRARGPNAFGGGRKQKATMVSVGGQSAAKTGRSEEVPEEGAITVRSYSASRTSYPISLFLSAFLHFQKYLLRQNLAGGPTETPHLSRTPGPN